MAYPFDSVQDTPDERTFGCCSTYDGYDYYYSYFCIPTDAFTYTVLHLPVLPIMVIGINQPT